MRSSNKLNGQKSGGIVSAFKNGLTWASELLTFKIEYKQIAAMWMICALLLPVFAVPVNVAAMSDNRNKSAEEDYS